MLEQVNNSTWNAVTLHTSEGCTVERKYGDTNFGTTTGPDANNSDDCNFKNAYQGCSIRNDGAGNINNSKGGLYVCEWKAQTPNSNGYVKTWFLSHDSSQAKEIKNMEGLNSTINTSSFPTPNTEHVLDNSKCSYGHLKNMRLILNLAFCGQWAGAIGCSTPQTKEGFTDPTFAAGDIEKCTTAFANKLKNVPAYNPDHLELSPYKWIINNIKTFTPDKNVLDDSSKTKTSSNILLYVILGVIGAILIILLGYILYYVRKK
jgi:hypothetical protein